MSSYCITSTISTDFSEKDEFCSSLLFHKIQATSLNALYKATVSNSQELVNYLMDNDQKLFQLADIYWTSLKEPSSKLELRVYRWSKVLHQQQITLNETPALFQLFLVGIAKNNFTISKQSEFKQFELILDYLQKNFGTKATENFSNLARIADKLIELI